MSPLRIAALAGTLGVLCCPSLLVAQEAPPARGAVAVASPGILVPPLQIFEQPIAAFMTPGPSSATPAVHESGDAERSAAGGPYTPSTLPCSINVACVAGQAWQEEARAVVNIVMDGGATCSGVLLNNTRQDRTPYVLTANHCGNLVVGQTVNWEFRFNYQSETCADPVQEPAYDVLTGAVVRAAAAGNADFTLFELNAPVPESFGASFAGWSIEDVTPAAGVVIGHPGGDLKKITIDDDPLTTFAGIFWQATFDHGTIEASSSGSPLFNENHEFVGHLKASTQIDQTACSGPGGDDNGATIIFPKFALLFRYGDAGQRIADFLDPDGTGSTSVPPLGVTAPVWINEINADADPAGNKSTEFVEFVGPAGTVLDDYRLEVYACSGGTATLQASEVVGRFTLPSDYDTYGMFVLGGSGLEAGVRDQAFGTSGKNVLPDGSGLLVLKDGGGAEVFAYQYDGASQCPASRTTRSAGDIPGEGSMGFVVGTSPGASSEGVNTLVASPGAQNFDGGQELPVELTSFEALLDGSDVVLSWATASETNNAGFEVQRYAAATSGRRNKTTGGTWEAVGFVDGYGTTAEPQAYTYRMRKLSAGTYRFRLKQVDYDGTFDYSPEVEVAVALEGRHNLSKAYPNPFNPETQFSLSVARGQLVEVAVYDLLGRQVARLFDGWIEEQTTRSYTFDGGMLPSGLYLIRARGETFTAMQTVTLVK